MQGLLEAAATEAGVSQPRRQGNKVTARSLEIRLLDPAVPEAMHSGTCVAGAITYSPVLGCLELSLSCLNASQLSPLKLHLLQGAQTLSEG